MTRIFNILILLMLSVVCGGPFAADAAGPRISFEREIVDLGRVPVNQKVTVHFPFINTGDSPLIIDDVKAGCGCTKVSKKVPPVAPNSRSEISAELDTGEMTFGKKTRRLLVTGNDPQRRNVVLTIAFEVVQE
jgi:hypothetical protein